MSDSRYALPKQERLKVVEAWKNGETQEQVARKYSISRETVQRYIYEERYGYSQSRVRR